VEGDVVHVRRPEKETKPKLFYKDAHHATLDPLAAVRPAGGLFMWSEQGDVPHQVPSGHPGAWNSAAAAVLSYDVPHRAPWDWRVSLYTWTKGVATGSYLVALALAASGLLPWTSALWRTVVPVLAGVFLALTGALLVADLEHPRRFLLIFTRPQWRSWLVRGGVLITAFSLVLLAHFVAGVAGWGDVPRLLAWAGAPLALLTAVYTAYLFAQAKARDLWQNPLAPVQLAVQAALVGAAALLLVVQVMGNRVLLAAATGSSGPMVGIMAPDVLLWVVGASAALHLLLVLGEYTLTHATAHARLAAREMTRGRYAVAFWAGAILAANAVLAPWVGVWAAVPALLAVLAHEHAYVQAGQAVPLA
jgi:hypothetical protein